MIAHVWEEYRDDYDYEESVCTVRESEWVTTFRQQPLRYRRIYICSHAKNRYARREPRCPCRPARRLQTRSKAHGVLPATGLCVAAARRRKTFFSSLRHQSTINENVGSRNIELFFYNTVDLIRHGTSRTTRLVYHINLYL